MRVYAGDPMGPFVGIFYEGIPIQGVTVADTDEGWVEMVCCDDRGRPIIDPRTHAIKTARMQGTITVDKSRWDLKQKGESSNAD